jgi:hypothetical protein
VKNTGTAQLTAVAVSDSRDVNVGCPKPALAAGEEMTCAAHGTVVSGQYRNVGTATGTPEAGGPVEASDPSHYFGAVGGIDIETATNGQDADAAPGALVRVGAAVTWTYEVRNTGNLTFTSVTVTDDQLGVIACPAATLSAGASMTCSATGVAAIDLYSNVGTVVATPQAGPAATDADPSHYFGTAPALDIETFTNGVDADTPPGPTITVGAAVSWVYQLTNTGNVDLTAVSVIDSQGVAVVCPTTTLASGGSMLCGAAGTATLGVYSTTGTATGTPPVGPAVTDADPTHYTGM